MILSVGLVVIHVNEIRRQEDEAGVSTYYTVVFGRLMFFAVTFFIILGNILLPGVVLLSW